MGEQRKRNIWGQVLDLNISLPDAVELAEVFGADSYFTHDNGPRDY